MPEPSLSSRLGQQFRSAGINSVDFCGIESPAESSLPQIWVESLCLGQGGISQSRQGISNLERDPSSRGESLVCSQLQTGESWG